MSFESWLILFKHPGLFQAVISCWKRCDQQYNTMKSREALPLDVIPVVYIVFEVMGIILYLPNSAIFLLFNHQFTSFHWSASVLTRDTSSLDVQALIAIPRVFSVVFRISSPHLDVSNNFGHDVWGYPGLLKFPFDQRVIQNGGTGYKPSKRMNDSFAV